MRHGIGIPIVAALFGMWVSAEERVMSISWETVKREGRLLAGEVVPPDKAGALEGLKVVGRRRAEPVPSTPGQVCVPLPTEAVTTILVLERPPITRATYAVRGRVRCDSVQGMGYLEMWNVFDGQVAYFSRTMDLHGPMRCLQGTTDWYEFVLPFMNREGNPPPVRLVLNIALPGPGTVYLGPLEVVQFSLGENPFVVGEGQWWDERRGGLIGGVFGTVVGCLGGLIGGLAARGKARAFVLMCLKGALALGGLALAVGIGSLWRQQPYHVWFPLSLTGGLLLILSAAFLPMVQRRYQEIELRRMGAMDA